MQQATDEQHETRAPSGFNAACMWAVRIAAALAIGMSAYLLYVSLSQTDTIIGCGGDRGCHDVLLSWAAYWMSIPVSAPALGFYLFILVCSFLATAKGDVNRRRLAWAGLLTGAIIIPISIIWFVGVQAISIKAYCTLCLTTHGLGLVAAAGIFLQRPITTPRSGANSGLLSFQYAGICGAAAALGIGLLIGGQFLGSGPATHRVDDITFSDPSPDANAPAQAFRLSDKTHVFLDGRLRIQPGDYPMLGSPDAPVVIVEVFDYTCEACRDLEPMLIDALKRYEGQLAIITIPCPIHRACNPDLPATQTNHADACSLARIGMALWHADPSKYEAYATWVFRGERPPTPRQAREHAYSLVGQDAFNKAADDPQINRLIRQGAGLYGRLQYGAMPKLILFDTRVQSGMPRSRAAFFETLENELDLD